MRVVPAIGRGTVGLQGTVSIPSLQGEHRNSNQFAKIFRRICMLHATSLHDSLRKINTVECSFLQYLPFLHNNSFPRCNTLLLACHSRLAQTSDKQVDKPVETCVQV